MLLLAFSIGLSFIAGWVVSAIINKREFHRQLAELQKRVGAGKLAFPDPILRTEGVAA